jgi:hypothetical protein
MCRCFDSPVNPNKNMEYKNRALNLFLPRLQDILFIATLVASFLLGSRMLSIDSDLGRHLAIGDYILNNRIVPTKDIFSHTLTGTERPPYEWLTQFLFAISNRVAGLDGVVLMVSIVIAFSFTFLYVQAAKRSGMPLTSLFLTILAMSASSLHWLPRPHIITFLFLALLLERLETVQRGDTVAIWQLPLLMLFWVNLHGGFIFGFLVLLAYLTGWAWEKWIKKSDPESANWRQLWHGFLLMGLASFLTPDGLGSWEAVLNNHSHYILSRTLETMPPGIHQVGTWPFFFLVILSVVFLLSARKQTQASHVFLLAGMACMGLFMARNIPLYAISAAFVLPLWAKESLHTWNKWIKVEERMIRLQKPLHGVLWPILMGLGLTICIVGRQVVQGDTLLQFDQRVFPTQAVDWLEKHPQSGHMFNEFNWGGYLLYRLWPDKRVFVDSQTDFYGEKMMREYEQVITASEGWENVLARYDVSWVILPQKARLTKVLQIRAGWETIYKDETAVIMRKAP